MSTQIFEVFSPTEDLRALVDILSYEIRYLEDRNLKLVARLEAAKEALRQAVAERDAVQYRLDMLAASQMADGVPPPAGAQ